MLIIVSGPSAVGKSFCVEYLCQRYGFRTIVPYTTRPARVVESEGVHYHFRSEDELRALSANFGKGYWDRPLNGDWYGYTEHVDELPDNPGNWIIQAYSSIALGLKKRHKDAVLVFLDYQTTTAMERRIRDRYGSHAATIKARLDHAAHEQGRRNLFDHVISADNPEVIVDKLAEFALENVVQGPPLPPTQPGPLSDTDILASLDTPHGIRVQTTPGKDLHKQINGWSVDLTLSRKYFRVSRRWLFDRIYDLAHGGEHEMTSRFRESYAADDEGIFLRPNEFILASTQERVSLPSNIVGIVTGRSSYSRLGLSVELSQNLLQPGHDDTIPLQVKNNLPYPIIIYAGVGIAQVAFFKTVSGAAHSYSRQSGAKYLGRLADIRSRFFDDPLYSEIRSKKQPRRKIDWDHTLNILLFLLIWALGAAWLVSQVTPAGTSNIAKAIQIIIFVLTTLVGVVRGLRLFHTRIRP